MPTPILLKTCLVAAFCFSLVSTSAAQDQRFVMKLNDQLISSFKSYGSLKSVIPAEAKNKIGYIELQFDETKDGEPIELDLGLTVANNEATVILDNSMIDKVKGQPVRIAVDEDSRDFGQVMLIYDAPTAASQIPAVKDADGNEMDMVYVRLDDIQVLGGGMEGVEKLDMTTKFGPVTIPMAQIAGVQFHVDAEDSAVVVLDNGDTVSGVPDFSNINLITDWGNAEIDAEHIRSITMTPDSRFRRQDSDFGPRWVLDTGNSLAPGAPPSN